DPGEVYGPPAAWCARSMRWPLLRRFPCEASPSPGADSGEPPAAPEHGGASLPRVGPCSHGPAGAAAAALLAIWCPFHSAAPALHSEALGHVAWFAAPGHALSLVLLAPQLRRESAPTHLACWCRARRRSPPS